MKTLRIALLCLSALGLASCGGLQPKSKPAVTSVHHVDLPRYMGPWRVIACMDNKLERDFVDAVETYKLNGRDKIDVHFAWRDKSFSAPVKTHDFSGTVEQDGTNATWKMQLFPLVKAGYVIIDVAPDYSYAAVAHPSKKYGWILARSRTLPPETYRRLLRDFTRQGFDTSKFILVPQKPRQERPHAQYLGAKEKAETGGSRSSNLVSG